MYRDGVTVIIPAYNAGKYIKQAIESVLSQEEIDAGLIELIVINDCSTDDTAEVLSQYATNPRVKIVTHDANTGVSQGRNEGIALAETEYVAFLDADDWWSSEKIKLQYTLAKETNAPIICAARELHTPEGEGTGRIIGVKDTISYEDLLRTNSIPCGSVLMKADIAKEFGFQMDNLHEDYILWLKVTKKYGPARGIDIPLLHCRLSEGGKSRNKLKSAKMHFMVYRYMGFGFFKSVGLFISYAFNGFRKYYG